MTVGKLCHVLKDHEVIPRSLSNVAKNENEARNGSSSMLSLHEWFGAFQKKKGAAFQNIPDTQPQLNRRQHSKCLTTIEATVQHYCHSAFNFSKAKILPMLAATVQHCYHPANMVPMLTLLPTTYPIGFSPLHSLHISTTFAKLTFQKQSVSQCWQPLCNTATTLPMCW